MKHLFESEMDISTTRCDLFFTWMSSTYLNLRKKLVKCYIWSMALYGALVASCSRSEMPGKFRNVVLEKDGKGQLDRSCEK